MKTWHELGIEVNASSGETDTQCPWCSKDRKKKRAKCLSVNVDKGTYFCHHCGISGGLKEGHRGNTPELHWRKPVYVRPDPKPTSDDLGVALVEFMAKRSIPAAVLRRNGISMQTVYMPQVEEHVKAICFPYYRGEEFINAKYRDREKNFRMEAGAERILYGLNDIDPARVVIVEGECDKLSVEVAGIKSCVSVPDGAPAINAKNYDSKFTFLDCDEVAAVKEWIIAVDNDPPGTRLEEELARRFGVGNCKRVKWPEGCKDANDVLKNHGPEALRKCIDSAEPFPISGVIYLSQLQKEVALLYEEGESRGVSTGWPGMDKYYTVQPGEVTVITGTPGSGKALALDTPVPTPSGWTTMGSLEVGDEVFDESGNPCKVTNAFDVRFDRPCYRVEFSDGSEIVADAEHLWVTRTEQARNSAQQTKKKRGTRDATMPRGSDQRWKKTFPAPVTTEEIARTLVTKSGRRNHAVSVALPIECEEKPLPIPPYTLGAWLGDGTSACGAITTSDAEVLDAIRADGFAVTRMPSTKYGYTVTGLVTDLRALALIGDKRVPLDYLRGSIEQRKALLAGLMDTDGHMGADGRCEFCNTNETLAKQVFELAASLGMRPTLGVGIASLYGKNCGPKYRVCFTPTFNPFRIERKRARYKTITKARIVSYRQIIAVEPVPSVPVRCIRVDSPTHQFLVGHAFIPTHNSNWLDALLVNLAKNHDWIVPMFSPENQPLRKHAARLMEKFIREPFRAGPTRRMSPERREAALEWCSWYFPMISPQEEEDWTLENIFKIAQALILRHGIKGLVIDPWNELEHVRPAHLSESEYIGLSLKKVRQFARRTMLHVFIVAHPAKLYRTKEGKYPMPTLYDISGSANWFNKPDNGLVIHRDKGNQDAPVEVHAQKIRLRETGEVGQMNFRYNRVLADYEEFALRDAWSPQV